MPDLSPLDFSLLRALQASAAGPKLFRKSIVAVREAMRESPDFTEEAATALSAETITHPLALRFHHGLIELVRKMEHSSEPLVESRGNFGTDVLDPAHPAYTETRVTGFGLDVIQRHDGVGPFAPLLRAIGAIPAVERGVACGISESAWWVKFVLQPQSAHLLKVVSRVAAALNSFPWKSRGVEFMPIDPRFSGPLDGLEWLIQVSGGPEGIAECVDALVKAFMSEPPNSSSA